MSSGGNSTQSKNVSKHTITLTPDMLKQLTFGLGKPLTQEEFDALKKENPSVSVVAKKDMSKTKKPSA